MRCEIKKFKKIMCISGESIGYFAVLAEYFLFANRDCIKGIKDFITGGQFARENIVISLI